MKHGTNNEVCVLLYVSCYVLCDFVDYPTKDLNFQDNYAIITSIEIARKFI